MNIDYNSEAKFHASSDFLKATTTIKWKTKYVYACCCVGGYYGNVQFKAQTLFVYLYVTTLSCRGKL